MSESSEVTAEAEAEAGASDQAIEQFDAEVRDLMERTKRTFMRLPISVLEVDRENYQRGMSEHKLRRISGAWWENGLGTLLVSMRTDGSYWIMDGGHRAEGTKRKRGADFLMDCLVYHGLSINEEARVFAFVNLDRGAVKTGRKYRALFMSGHPEVVAIVDLLDEMGIEHDWERSGDPGVLGCWAALHDVYRAGKSGHLESVLRLIGDSWSFTGLTGQMRFIKGISLFILNHEKDEGWHLPTIRQGLSRLSPENDILVKAKKIHDAHDANEQQCIYRAVHELYNRRRSGHQLEDVRTPRRRKEKTKNQGSE
jgi:hypothetical protein